MQLHQLEESLRPVSSYWLELHHLMCCPPDHHRLSSLYLCPIQIKARDTYRWEIQPKSRSSHLNSWCQWKQFKSKVATIPDNWKACDCLCTRFRNWPTLCLADLPRLHLGSFPHHCWHAASLQAIIQEQVGFIRGINCLLDLLPFALLHWVDWGSGGTLRRWLVHDIHRLLQPDDLPYETFVHQSNFSILVVQEKACNSKREKRSQKKTNRERRAEKKSTWWRRKKDKGCHWTIRDPWRLLGWIVLLRVSSKAHWSYFLLERRSKTRPLKPQRPEAVVTDQSTHSKHTHA